MHATVFMSASIQHALYINYGCYSFMEINQNNVDISEPNKLTNYRKARKMQVRQVRQLNTVRHR